MLSVAIVWWMQVIDNEKEDPAAMAYAYKMTWIWAGCLSVVVFVLWPLLALPAGVFSQSYFTFWIVIMMIWGFLAGEHPKSMACYQKTPNVPTNMHVTFPAFKRTGGYSVSASAVVQLTTLHGHTSVRQLNPMTL